MASHVILDDTILDALPYYIIEQLKPDYSGSIQPEILPVARRRHIVAVHAISTSLPFESRFDLSTKKTSPTGTSM
jgi:hypothetical protein